MIHIEKSFLQKDSYIMHSLWLILVSLYAKL
jgi:hypothetical protein